MLQEITLKNFKLFDEEGVTINPGKITVFIGANGTGKSSVLQALLLLKQSVGQSGLKFSDSPLQVGLYKDVVHLQDTTRTLTIRLSVSYGPFSFSHIDNWLPASGKYTYQAEFGQQYGELYRHEATIGDEDVQLTASGPREASIARNGVSLTDTRIGFSDLVQSELSFSTSIARVLTIANRSLAGGQRRSVAEKISSQLQMLTSTVDHLLARTYLVPALRGVDKFEYPILSYVVPADLAVPGISGERAQLIVNKIGFEPELADRASEPISKVIGTEPIRLGHRLAQNHRILGQAVRDGLTINLVNEASGVNSLVEPMIGLREWQSGSVIGIEEPEIHLHPKAQAALCDVFVDIANNEDKQLILTTHSEHILMGLLTAVTEGRLKPDELAVYEFQREGDAARAERLEVNEYGQIAGGLRSFLEVDIEQMGKFIAARFRGAKR